MEVMDRLETVEKKHHLEVERLKDEMSGLKKEHRQEVSHLNEEITELKQENSKLRKENQLLLDDNARLKSILDNDSTNSSLPPSKDQKGTKPANHYNGRTKSEKKAGGQNGHKGTTLTKAEVEEKLRSGKYRHEVRVLGDERNGRYITKYVVDLEVNPKITEIRIYAGKDGKIRIPPEYRSDVTYGAEVKALCVSLYSEGVMSNDRIASFLNAASGELLGLSEGSVYGFCRKLSDQSAESISRLEERLLNQQVVATDATTATENGKQRYIRNFSIADTVIYKVMESKSIPSLKKIEFLKRYMGILIHDHETAIYHFGTEHGECNVHLLRYLKKNTEETKNRWSEELSSLLCEINRKKKELIEHGKSFFSAEALTEYEKRYSELIEKGCEENKKTGHKYAKQEEKTLLNRLEKYRHNYLLFMHNFAVPFDDNISERDLRKIKNRQKMAGGFRKESGMKMYCAILTIIETLKKRKMGIIEHLRQLFMGAPAIF